MFMFGLGAGFLSNTAENIAAKHGAELVNYTDAPCSCGYGCNPYTCRYARRHWFVCKNYGEPHNSTTAKEVLKALKEESII